MTAGPPPTLRVGFVLLSNSQNPVPSTRIAVLNTFPLLRAGGIEPRILFDPLDAKEAPDLPDLVIRAREQQVDVVVFQKVHGTSALDQINRLAAAGIRTVYAVCDLIDPEMARATDATIVVTEYLRSLYPENLQSKIHVVHDGIEHPEIIKTDWPLHRGSPTHPLHAVLVTSMDLGCLPVLTSPPAWLRISIVGHYPPLRQTRQRLRWARQALARQSNLRERLALLRFMTDRRIRCVAWDPVTVYTTLQSADVAIIPIDRSPPREEDDALPVWQLKSENRLTMKMAVGLPVIATPIPSYLPIIEHGKNGYFAESNADWRVCLERLREPAERMTIGERARASVIATYSKEEQARRLISVLRNLGNG